MTHGLPILSLTGFSTLSLVMLQVKALVLVVFAADMVDRLFSSLQQPCVNLGNQPYSNGPSLFQLNSPNSVQMLQAPVLSSSPFPMGCAHLSGREVHKHSADQHGQLLHSSADYIAV